MFQIPIAEEFNWPRAEFSLAIAIQNLAWGIVQPIFGALAEKNDWAGVVVNGCVRDSEELAEQEVGIKALATHPRKSEKGLHTGHVDRVVEFAGVRFVPGAWLYADADGIVVAESAVHKG